MSHLKKNTTDTKERTSPKKPGSPTSPLRASSPTSPDKNAPPSALRNAASPSNQSSISFKDQAGKEVKDQTKDQAKDQATKDSSPDLRPAAQQRLATRRSLASAISPQTFSLERDLTDARGKIQHLDGECERLKHQVTNLKQDVKRSHASLFDMTSLKNQLAAQVEDLMLEKEDLRQQVLNAGMKHTLELQEMNLKVMDIQKALEKKDAEMANQENIVMALRAEVERLHQGGGKSHQTSSTRFKSPLTGNAESEEEVQNTHVKAIRLEMANVQLAEQVEKLQAINSDNGITISNLRQENTTLKEDLKRMKAFIANAGLVLPAKLKGKEEQVSSGVPTFICIEEAKAKQQFAIERDALQSLIAEGLTLFEELYNAHRVMRRNAMDDVDRATQLWLGLSAAPNARRSSTSPPQHSPNRRDSAAISSSMLAKSPEQSINPQPKIYVMSWYKGKGADMLQSWLAHSSNIFSPALVQALISHGFSDMQAISKLTEEDLAAMCVTAGVRRKVLSAVEELNQKLAVVQQETQTMLRESFSLSPSYYDTKEGKADAEEDEDDEDAEGVPGLKANQRRRRRKNCYAELSELLNELQNWFADTKVAIEAQEGAVDRIFTLSTVEGEKR